MYKIIKETSGFALLSSFLGLFSFYTCVVLVGPDWLPIITSLFAILFGMISLYDIKRKNYKGRSFAIFGIIFGILELALYILLILSYYKII